MKTKVKSFTLSELLVAMIITVIVVGLAFTVLNLVKKQITFIQKNYDRTSELAFFKQRIWLDFNKNKEVIYNLSDQKLLLKSEFDSVYYYFNEEFVIRNTDTLKTKLQIKTMYFLGNEVEEGTIDAISFLEKKEAADSHFFVFKKNDATLFMNQDGF